MKLLKARLYEFEREKQRAAHEKHYNDKGAINWGNQIRSYVFMPYQLVKDHRTGHETSRLDLVINGKIDEFMNKYLLLKFKNKEKNKYCI
jgi:peptide chain release factor 2